MHDAGEGLMRHLAAVMFTDMVGYTALMQSDEAAALENRARHRMALEQTTASNGGRVLQYFGDGSLSLFHSSMGAVMAAIEIQRTLGRSPLVRIGLHLGDVAYDEQGAYGDAINIAARLEALAQPGGVLISRKIFDEIQSRPEVQAQHVADVRLKNVRGSVGTYALIIDGLEPVPPATDEASAEIPAEGSLPSVVQHRLDERAKPLPLRVDPPSGNPDRIPLVGRDREMATIRQLVEVVESGQGRTLFVKGPRGVGKTRIAEETADLVRDRGWAVLTGRAYAAETRAPLAPFADAFLPILKGLDEPTLASLVPGGVDALGALFPALGISEPLANSNHLQPGELQARLFWHFTEMLGRISEHRPLLVTLENLDLADRTSLELLHFVARRCVDVPILVMCQYTGMDDHQRNALLSIERALSAENVGSALKVQPFNEEETKLFITRALADDHGPVSDLSSRLFEWTEGVPLFLKGTLRGLVDEGRLQLRDGEWYDDELSALGLPESVRDAVLVWTSRLSEPALALSELLAVAGTQMTHESLQHVSGLVEAEFTLVVDELIQHQVLSESEAEWTLVYDFRHPLIRETVRGDLSSGKRRQLHGRIADSLERYYRDDAEGHAEELAYHFALAPPGPMRLKAIRYLAEAGGRALFQHANREAAAHFGEALERIEAVPSGPRREAFEQDSTGNKVVMGLATALRRLGKVEESVAHLQSQLHRTQEAGDTQASALIHREIGFALMRGGQLEGALEEFGRGVGAARKAGVVPLVVRIQLAHGISYQAAGRPAEARDTLEQALLLAKKIKEPILLARAHSALIQLHLFRGELAEGRAHAESALRLAEETGAKGVAFWSQWAMGAMEGLIGNTAEMAKRIEAAKRLADELGSPFLQSQTAELAVELDYARGNWISGIAAGERAADVARALGRHPGLPRLLTWLSLMYIGRGELEKAKAATDEAWRLSGADGAVDNVGSTNIHSLAPAHIGRAAYHMALGEWDEAVRVAELGLAIADRSGYVVWAIHHLLPIIAEASIHARRLEVATETARRMRAEADAVGHPLGLVWADACDAVLTWLQGDPERGAVALRAGVESLETIPLTFEAAKLRRQLAGRLAEIGDIDGAVAELHKAHAVFVHLGARPELEATRNQFEEVGADPPESIDGG